MEQVSCYEWLRKGPPQVLQLVAMVQGLRPCWESDPVIAYSKG